MIELWWKCLLCISNGVRVRKTRVALDIIDLLVEKNPDIFVLIVVPTEILKEQ